MSVNISVNGKIEKGLCKKQSILADSERVRKDLENERRILRLRQVRQESNNLARKIRQEVDEEKERQLKKLEDIKQKELNCWRQHVLAKKHNDFRSAVFQVGAAHRAAVEENTAKQKRKEEIIKQTKAKFHNTNKTKKEIVQKENVCDCRSTEKSTTKTNSAPSSHHHCCKVKSARHKTNANKKRKLSGCCRKQSECACKHSDDNTDDDVSLLSSDTTSSFHLNSDSEPCNSVDKKKNLQKTDPIILEVDVDSDESLSVSTKGAIEINDQFIESNRRFCRVVQTNMSDRVETTKTTNSLSNENRPKTTTVRFTQISDFVKQCSQSDNAESSSNRLTNETDQQTVASKSALSSINDKSKRADVRSTSPTTRISSEIEHPISSNACGSTAVKGSISTSTVIIRQAKDSGTSSANSARVKFYDYNNKFQKNYDQSVSSVQVNLPDATQLNAMDHAQIENQLQQLREQEIEKLRKITEERGQKALEREQVRRDCVELTEKLDALSRQHPQLLPNDANFVASHRFEDLRKSREKKMEEIMEKMLFKPAIITCPEVSTKHDDAGATKTPTERTAINLGDQWTKATDSTSTTSDSCCSILLDNVDDQSKKLRNDLKACDANAEKAEKLAKLLERIEQIREGLMKELKAGNVPSDGENLQNVIQSIRQERSAILSEKQRSLDARESKLLKKEALLDKKIRELYDAKKASGDGTKNKTQNAENDQVLQHFGEKPLEIIIKVKSDGQVTKCIAKQKANKKIATKPATEPQTFNAAQQATTTGAGIQRENSYDSNSTAYRSLPPMVSQNIDAIMQHLSARTTECETQAMPNLSRDASEPLNPLIVYYVQRLLGMTRQSIQELGVSSSDITTPSSSIINIARNNSVDAAPDESLIDEKRMKHVQNFIEENRTFVQELEDTLRSHSNASLETSMQAFDNIWTKRLQRIRGKDDAGRQQTNNSRVTTPRKKTECPCGPPVVSATPKSVKRNENNRQVPARKPEQVKNAKEILPKSPRANTICTESEKHIERYAKLTENCTQRIAELTELIHKVREEKQRLLEVTLTSNSDAGRNSTEYFELPATKENQRARTNSDRSRSSDINDHPTSTTDTMPLTENEPLQKHKQIGASRDSGISESRPVTSQDQVHDAEPSSVASSTKAVTRQRQREKSSVSAYQRLSPNLIDERIVHELSTIVEVDTPAPSSANLKGVSNNTTLKEISGDAKIRQPVKFPSFKQYAQELNLDISQISNDQSIRLQHEYNELLLAINQRANNTVDYQEFPSIRSYLHNVTTTSFQNVTDGSIDMNSPQAIRDLIQCLRMASIKIRSFPTQKEYMAKLLANKPENERDIIDSASLENSTDFGKAKPQTDSDTTDSFNVEAELKKRKILKASFQRSAMSTGNCMASSTQRESAAFFTGPVPTESGIEKLSSSQYDAVSDEIDREMQRLGMQWPATMRKRQKQADALSSGSSEDKMSNQQQQKQRKRNNISHSQKATSLSAVSNESGNMGRTLNLREFLTKELLKQVNQNISSSSDDSLKSNFLQSVIDSLTTSGTPLTNNAMGTGTAATLDRQKTSTPVMSSKSSRAQSHSSPTAPQLFSGESKLSSVHFPSSEPSGHPNSRADDDQLSNFQN